MSTNKKLVSSLNPLIETRDVAAIKGKTGNLYESIVVASKRANQINISVKEELHRKLDDFANHTDTLEEVHENKEQIEISRFYERMANPALQSLSEFMNDKIYYRKKDQE
ncbi:DNA-directed RNA polymerase subunit omega [Taibaiella lutea]|jgi:DNA-directed RNA polymerase subunit K/omega|uniref:DNA-directed RNA polymerase subunit omega n=1 Tax=Taibaiella lutea TaxID=2608001 RepID=A0A5M6CEH4_9BACT|nr:DNA-directed RNA polymerase subunit omega [Taibaiella lutea]KAA5532282.1 DNA-directed RNA polymerase subunit omega [Taibaiella lutea]